MLTAPELNPADLVPPTIKPLSAILRSRREHTLRERDSLTRETYSTERFLSGLADQNSSILSSIHVGSGKLLFIEASSPALQRYAAERGLQLADDVRRCEAVELAKAAVSEVIEPYPFLCSAISELAWRCHIIIAKDDDYDTSFSDPAIPFSIFISAPNRNDRSSVMRVAENLIHETMHLQLTLFEELFPLVNSESNWSVYSPWKQQARPTQGVLHGIYVFSVLRWMWQQVSRTAQSKIDRDFALRRIVEIEKDVSATQLLRESPAITEAGRRLLHILLVG